MAKEKKGINKNVLLIVLAIPFLVAFGVFAGSYLTGASTQVVSGNEANEQQLPETTVPLEEFLLNLEPIDNVYSYMRLEVSLSSTKEDGVEKINANLDKIRDVIIYKVSRLTVDDIFDEDQGTQKLKELLRTAINELFGEDLIHDVYLTNIVVQ